jgi:transcriptional regulator with PAS, ATPase and Fis domain
LKTGVWTAFRQYSWPGNVRQIENTIQRLCCWPMSPCILLRDLPKPDTGLRQKSGVLPALSLREREFAAIISALEK